VVGGLVWFGFLLFEALRVVVLTIDPKKGGRTFSVKKPGSRKYEKYAKQTLPAQRRGSLRVIIFANKYIYYSKVGQLKEKIPVIVTRCYSVCNSTVVTRTEGMSESNFLATRTTRTPKSGLYPTRSLNIDIKSLFYTFIFNISVDPDRAQALDTLEGSDGRLMARLSRLSLPSHLSIQTCVFPWCTFRNLKYKSVHA
jgi:hypothetical protein